MRSLEHRARRSFLRRRVDRFGRSLYQNVETTIPTPEDDS